MVLIDVGQDAILRRIGNPPGTVLNNWKADYQSAAGYQPAPHENRVVMS
jgi:hypothetical protein